MCEISGKDIKKKGEKNFTNQNQNYLLPQKSNIKFKKALFLNANRNNK